jgi:hypothetical protein
MGAVPAVSTSADAVGSVAPTGGYRVGVRVGPAEGAAMDALWIAIIVVVLLVLLVAAAAEIQRRRRRGGAVITRRRPR